eukprot:497618_1
MASQSQHQYITNKDLLNIHHQRLNHQKFYNPDEILKVIDILDGFENVFSVLLTSHEIYMDPIQLSQIRQVIQCNKKHFNNNRTLITTAPINNNQLESDLFEKKVKWTHYFSQTNTPIHSLFRKKIADAMVYVIGLNYLISIALILATINISMTLVADFAPSLDSHCLIFIRMILSVVLSSLIIYNLLISNKQSLKLLICSFEFWIKLFYGIQLSVCYFIYFYINTDYIQQKQRIINADSTAWIIAGLIARLIIQIFAVLWVITVDSRNPKMKRRLYIQLLLAITYTVNAVHWFLKAYAICEQRFINITGAFNGKEITISVSLLSVIGGSCEILAMFLWKQVYYSYKNVIKNGERCAIIKYSPYIKWIENDHINGSEQASTVTFDNDTNDRDIPCIQMQNINATKESISSLSSSSEFKMTIA